MTWGFLCWGETLVHTCIHLKSHWLYTLLSWCAYTKKKKKKGSNDLKHVLPWLQRRIGKITGWHGDGTGHVWVILQLLISKWEWFEQVWSNAAIWGCCQLEGVRAAPGFGGTWEKNHQTGASSGTLLASPPSLYDHLLLAVPLSISSMPVATFWKSIRFQNKCAHADLLRINKKCEMKTDLVIFT